VGLACARLFQVCLAVSVLVTTGPASMAQGQAAPPEQAPPGVRVTVIGEAPTARPTFRGEYLYESMGYVFHKAANYDREFFEITPGHSGQAIFVKGAAAATVDLEFKLTMLSPTQPGVFYWIFRERNRERLWAVQANSPSVYGYGIFVNDSGNPFSIRDWVVYDFSRRSPEW
jgi:hypothetical protein